MHKDESLYEAENWRMRLFPRAGFQIVTDTVN